MYSLNLSPMKLILIFLTTLLLSACIYTEGSIIKEPQDVVVRDSITKFGYCEDCGSVDVTNSSHSTRTK